MVKRSQTQNINCAIQIDLETMNRKLISRLKACTLDFHEFVQVVGHVEWLSREGLGNSYWEWRRSVVRNVGRSCLANSHIPILINAKYSMLEASFSHLTLHQIEGCFTYHME